MPGAFAIFIFHSQKFDAPYSTVLLYVVSVLAQVSEPYRYVGAFSDYYEKSHKKLVSPDPQGTYCINHPCISSTKMSWTRIVGTNKANDRRQNI